MIVIDNSVLVSALVDGGPTGKACAARLSGERLVAPDVIDLEGAWYFDGFAGALGELVTAIAEDRDPSNSARDNLLSLELTLAACRSADEGGAAVTLA